MVLHFIRIGILTVLLGFSIFYPFLPGEFDGMAMPLSIMAQLLGTVGLLLVPIGALWRFYEGRKQAKRKQNVPMKYIGYFFAIASLVAASFVAIVISLLLLLSTGFSLGVLALGLWIYTISKSIPDLKRLKRTEAEEVNPVPYYLVLIPIVLLLLQVTLARRATEFSRNHAIANSTEIIQDIENHYTMFGRYPDSLLSVNQDYKPLVVGIQKFHYAADGDTYHLFFEQPRLLFDNLGTREYVVYNKLDDHLIPSHAYWILIWTPEELAARQGWYETHDTSSPHWKYFWFD